MSEAPKDLFEPADVQILATISRTGERHVVVATRAGKELHRDQFNLNSDASRKRFVAGIFESLPDLSDRVEEFRRAFTERLLALAAVPPGAAEPPKLSDNEDESPSNSLPDIRINDRQYRDVEEDSLCALVAANWPPTVFVGNGCGLVDLCRDGPDSALTARELEAASLRSVLARVANWLEVSERGDVSDAFPPSPLLSSLVVRGDWPKIPFLRSITTYPVFGPGWPLLARPGFHPGALIYCDLGNLVVPDVPARPSAAEVTAARELILTELFGDFPFVDGASRANAVAMLLLPIIRPAIDGPTPLGVIDAPTEGTGKTLLAEVSTLVSIGEIPEAVSPDMTDEEWNKFLLAELIAGQPVILLDNANRKVDSGALASALTARMKRGRILGETRMAKARVSVSWILTANNFECSREIARRVYWIRVDRGVENPAAFVGYRHANLLEWVRANRPRLLAAIITLVMNWLARGKPSGTKTLGKFEAWASAVGGILEAAGIAGFLGNADEFRRLASSQSSEMPEFVAKWYERHASLKVIAKDLFEIANDVLESVINAPNEAGRRTQFGKFLRTQRDRVYGDYRIRFAEKEDGSLDTDYADRPRYRLEKLTSSEPPRTQKAPGPDKLEYSEEPDGWDLGGIVA